MAERAGGLARGSWEVCLRERDLERPRVLLSAVHVTVRRCLCDIVMLSSCAFVVRGGSAGPVPLHFRLSRR